MEEKKLKHPELCWWLQSRSLQPLQLLLSTRSPLRAHAVKTQAGQVKADGEREVPGTRPAALWSLPPGESRVSTLAAILLRAAEIVLVVGVWVSRGTGIAAHGALPLTLQDTCLGKQRGFCNQWPQKWRHPTSALSPHEQSSLCLFFLNPRSISPNSSLQDSHRFIL